MARPRAIKEVSNPSSIGEGTSDQAQLCDTFTSRDYEVILDVLYGLFSQDSAEKVRVYDPFIADARRAPLVTPRMLTERLEALLAEQTAA